VTWRPEIWHTVSFDEYLHCVKISAFYVQPFGVIRKKAKTWTHLPEKLLSKNKRTRSARAMSQFDRLLANIGLRLQSVAYS